MSMGYLVGDSAPVVWRGLMVMKALQQLLHEVSWGGLDILVLDLPPGTGDTQLTITQQIILDGKWPRPLYYPANAMTQANTALPLRTGAIIISTPQDIALKDAIKGINMFRKTNTPILGMIQNMSVFVCPHCQASTPIFSPHSHLGRAGGGGVTAACATHGIDFLGDIPLHASICEDADRGKPTVVSEPESSRGKAFMDIAERVGRKIELF
jgi:ATP-binding protein involved in chromosome partitioning